MKKSTGYLKCTAVLALVVVLIALTLWVKNIYRSAVDNYMQTVDKCLKQAADEELRMRLLAFGDNYYTWFIPNKDTSTYITKTIEIDDGRIYRVKIRKDDPTAATKLRQLSFHLSGYPLNVAHVDSLFKRCMAQNSYLLSANFIEHIDLENDTIIACNAPVGERSGYHASNIDTLDITKTIGVRANTKIPLLVLHRPVMLDFAVAMVLMLIVMACIVKLIVDIRKLQAEGFRLLRFVSLKAEHSLLEVKEKIEHTAEKLHDKGMKEEAGELEKATDGILVSKGYFERVRCINDNEEGKIKFNFTVFPLKPLLEELVDRYEKIIYKHVSMGLTVEGEIYMYSDREYLKRILEELLDNAVKHTGNPVPVQILATQQDQKIVIVVCDCGGGISQSDLNNLYIVNRDLVRFYNDEIKREMKAGLGLSFVLSFVRSLGGKFKITSEEDTTGARIEFNLSKDDLMRIDDYKKNEMSRKPLGKTINLSEHKRPKSGT